MNFQLTVLQGDIVKVVADAIVNPTDRTFSMSGEVGECIIKLNYCIIWAGLFQIKYNFPFALYLEVMRSVIGKFVPACSSFPVIATNMGKQKNI